jgi:hypothetical protein
MGGLLSVIKQRIQGWLTRSRLANTPAGGVVNFEAPGKIYDGVPYALPAVVPYGIRNDAAAVAEFRESIANEFKHQFGSPFGKGGPVQMPTVSRPLEEWDWSTRKYILEQCHLAWERNPIAKTAVFYNRAFSVQNGASISFKNKDVERICQAFIDDPENSVRDLEKTTVDGLFVDGEAFFRFFKGDGIEGGKAEIKIVPLVPWGIMGIKHAVGFWRRVEYYRYRLTQDDGDDDAREFKYVDEQIPADEVHHIAINRLSYERRGRPEMFAMLPWLQAHKEWLENRARQNFWRGSVMFWVKLINALPSQVIAKLNAYKRPPQPGSVVVSNDKEEWTQFSPSVGASDASEDGRQLRAMAAAGARLPESWLSDGADANLATAKAQALPAVMSFGEMQDIMVEKFWKPILKRVIENAIEAGELSEDVEEQDADGEKAEKPKPKPKPMIAVTDKPVKEAEDTPGAGKIKACDAFTVTYSELGSDDPKSVIEAIVAALNANLVSEKTARGLTPWQLDTQAEEKQIRLERDQQLEDMANGLTPMIPGQNAPLMPTMADNSDEDTNGSDNTEKRPNNPTAERSAEALAA